MSPVRELFFTAAKEGNDPREAAVTGFTEKTICDTMRMKRRKNRALQEVAHDTGIVDHG